MLSLSLSKSQRKSCCVSLEDYFYMKHLFSILLSFWSKIPNHAAWRAGRVRGHTGDKRTPSSSTLPHSVTRRWSRLSNRAALTMTAFLLLHVFACGQRCLPSSTSVPLLRLLLASCPALLRLCSHSCDWLVSRGLSPVTYTQRCFGCSSGKQVSMFVLFVFTQIKNH